MKASKQPPFASILDWVEGRVSPEEAQQIADAIATSDAATHATVAWLQSFQRVHSSLVFEEPPKATHDLLVRRFAAFAQARQRQGILQRFVAVLTFDSGSQPALVGVRGVSDTAQRRQCMYSSDVADVALNITRRLSDQRFDLSGQVFLKSEEMNLPLVVDVLQQEQTMAAMQTDDLGEFHVRALGFGEYTILLRSGAAEMILVPIELRLEP